MAYQSIPAKLRNQVWAARLDNPRARDLLQAAGDYERTKAAADHVAEIHRRIRQHAASNISSLWARRLYLIKSIDGSLLPRCQRDAAEAKAALKAELARYQANV